MINKSTIYLLRPTYNTDRSVRTAYQHHKAPQLDDCSWVHQDQELAYSPTWQTASKCHTLGNNDQHTNTRSTTQSLRSATGESTIPGIQSTRLHAVTHICKVSRHNKRHNTECKTLDTLWYKWRWDDPVFSVVHLKVDLTQQNLADVLSNHHVNRLTWTHSQTLTHTDSRQTQTNCDIHSREPMLREWVSEEILNSTSAISTIRLYSAIYVGSRWKIWDRRQIKNTDNTETKHNPTY